jgi:hypothetical protein
MFTTFSLSLYDLLLFLNRQKKLLKLLFWRFRTRKKVGIALSGYKRLRDGIVRSATKTTFIHGPRALKTVLSK